MESAVAFAILLGFMVFVHELGHFAVAKLAGVKVEEFGIGFPPRLVAFRRGETEYSLNALPLGGFVRMLGEEDPKQPRSFARAKKRWRVAILLAGSAMNLVAAALFFAVGYVAGWPTPVPTDVEIQQTMPGSPAERAGLRAGDYILSFAGQPVRRSTDLRQLTEANLGREVPVGVRRGDATLEVPITPRAQSPEGQGALGIIIRDFRVDPVSHNPVEALALGAREVGRSILLTAAIPALALQGVVPLELLRPVGPVGLYQATSQAAAETTRTGWWFPLLYMAGTLGTGLGVANLLPIPGLDGGRLVFVAVEWLRGRRVSPEREGLIHLVGMAVLLSLVVVITYFDILFPVNVDFTLR